MTKLLLSLSFLAAAWLPTAAGAYPYRVNVYSNGIGCFRTVSTRYYVPGDFDGYIQTTPGYWRTARRTVEVPCEYGYPRPRYAPYGASVPLYAPYGAAPVPYYPYAPLRCSGGILGVASRILVGCP